MRKPVLRFIASVAVLAAVGLVGLHSAQTSALVIDTPLPPPAWALLERELLRANSEACRALRCKNTWTTAATCCTRPAGAPSTAPTTPSRPSTTGRLLHALGGSDDVLDIYKKAQEGHWLQYSELRTDEDRAGQRRRLLPRIHHACPTGFTPARACGLSCSWGFPTRTDDLYRERMKRFAGLYMNEDPEAPNYDPEHKVIKSIWTGSKGPMLHKATTYDWVGDPVPGRFHLLHNPAQRARNARPREVVPEDAGALRGVSRQRRRQLSEPCRHHPGLNAYMLTGEEKYRDWVLEYVDAWKQRTAATGGNIPSNVGLDGKPGGEYNGQWWKGTYGWNFTIFDGELEQTVAPQQLHRGSWPGFGNAYLLTGDRSYIDVLRRQMDNLYAQKKVVDGKVMFPRCTATRAATSTTARPSGITGPRDLHTDRLAEIYLWSMDRKDLERVPKEGWIGFLEGRQPGLSRCRPCRRISSYIRERMDEMRNDPTSPDTRLAD